MRRLLMAVSLALVVPAAAGVRPLAADPVQNRFPVVFKVAPLVAGARYTFTFRLFDAAVAGNELFEESKAYKVPATKLITHLLGSVNLASPLDPDHFLQQLWVEASVPGRAPFTRVKLAPSPLAIGSQEADRLDGLHGQDFALAWHSHGGSGSGFVADLLDGLDSTEFFTLAGDVTVTGVPTFEGGAAGPPFLVTSAEKVEQLNADLLDGLDSTAFQTRLGRVAVVAASGGDYTNPATAVYFAGSQWCTAPGPSAAAPCLVRVMPGVYDLGTGALQMKPFVDVEGSGERTTVIRSARSGAGTATLLGASDAEARFLSVENVATSGFAAAIYNSGTTTALTFITARAIAPGASQALGVVNFGGAPVLRDVAVEVSGAAANYGVQSLNGSSPVMTRVGIEVEGGALTTNIGVHSLDSTVAGRDVVASVAGGFNSTNYGFLNIRSGLTLVNSTGTASGGSSAQGLVNSSAGSTGLWTVTAEHCLFEGASSSVANDPNYALRIGVSRLAGPKNAFGTWFCAGCYDGNFAPLGATCD